MLNVVTGNDKGFIADFCRKLTNHNERPKRMVDVYLKDKKGEAMDQGRIQIYSNDPIHDINRKVKKLREEGDMHTLQICKLDKITENEYTLILSM